MKRKFEDDEEERPQLNAGQVVDLSLLQSPVLGIWDDDLLDSVFSQPTHLICTVQG